MPWVSIHDYTNAAVLIVEYDESVVDVEEEVVKPEVKGCEYEWMCMSGLNLVVKGNGV